MNVTVNYEENRAAPETFVGNTYSITTALEQMALLSIDVGTQLQLMGLARRVREMAAEQANV